jgi:RND family efflux transporter MFP subunit
VKFTAKIIAPILVLVGAVAITTAMISARPTVDSKRPPDADPLVRVLRVVAAPVTLEVEAQGTVEPRTESDLVTEVSGRIVWVSPNLASGGFFDAGDPLVRIDPRDYEVALEGALAAMTRAEANAVHAAADLARQRNMGRSGASSRSRLDDAVHNQASALAGVREAKVAVRRAELDLERSEIVAPFEGRVRDKHVDVGQFVGRGVAVARVYSVDYAEVRLPISDSELAFLDPGVGLRGVVPAAPAMTGDVVPSLAPREDPSAMAAPDVPHAPRVVLSAEYGGQVITWEARLVRTEGALDPRTRMLTVVARVDDPYGRTAEEVRPVLPVGLFVNAVIEGREVADVFEVPRSALRRGSRVLVVDDENRLHFRPVEILRTDGERSWIRSGLEVGERVVTSPIEIVTDGMKVRTTENTRTGSAAARGRFDARELLDDPA